MPNSNQLVRVIVGQRLHKIAGRESHAYVHMVDFGQAVEIRGMKIRSGDLLSEIATAFFPFYPTSPETSAPRPPNF